MICVHRGSALEESRRTGRDQPDRDLGAVASIAMLSDAGGQQDISVARATGFLIPRQVGWTLSALSNPTVGSRRPLTARSNVRQVVKMILLQPAEQRNGPAPLGTPAGCRRQVGGDSPQRRESGLAELGSTSQASLPTLDFGQLALVDRAHRFLASAGAWFLRRMLRLRRAKPG